MKNSRRDFLKASTVLAALAYRLPVRAGSNPRSATAPNADGETLLEWGQSIISEAPSPGLFPLIDAGRAVAPLWYDTADYRGVARAAGDLANDIERVCGSRPPISSSRPAGSRLVIIGTLGKCRMIDNLAETGKFDASALADKWERFTITTVDDPIPGVEQALLVAGSDKRGTIYGLYELSEQLGVSPWYWWADVPAKRRLHAYMDRGKFTRGEPAVRYRGIFINDEWPCLTRWTDEKYGGFNSKMYTHMFELILRLRGNYLWPAMWASAFNEDDPKNPYLADEYGVVMGTSHSEPMLRAQQEWDRHRQKYGNGQWNYATNGAGLRAFWRKGIRRNRDYESVITIGMRGDGDLPMPSMGSMAANISLLERIVRDQRKILADNMNPDVTKIPQLWALFDEVQKYYAAGMQVPDDVTILWTDDNTGNIRRLPTATERCRSGGAGVYYHFDMHGGPFSYQWINTNPFPKIWEQMNLAYHYDATRIWICNIGDLKPLELPMEFFLRMAWSPAALTKDRIAQYTRHWVARDFGPEHVDAIADIVSKYTKYNGWRKPELVKPDTFSQIHYLEAERVAAAWEAIVEKAEALYASIPAEQRDAFYQLVLHPAKASATVVFMQIAAGRTAHYARQGRASANAQAKRTRELFASDQEQSDVYNKKLADGRWNHLMDQTHIGEITWEPPRANFMPAVSEILVPDSDDFGVAIDGNPNAWPHHYGDAVLPTFDSLNRKRSYIEVFSEGTQPITFKIQAEQSWIVITEDGMPRDDRRFWVDIDWAKLPAGSSTGTILVTGKKAPVTVKVVAVKASRSQLRQAKGHFSSLTGPIAVAASSAVRNVQVNGIRWAEIPDYGRGRAAMSIFPVTAESVLPPKTAPRLEYPIYTPRTGRFCVTLILGPVMNFVPGRGMRIATAFDDDAPQVIDLFADLEAETFLGDQWENVTKDNARLVTSTHTLTRPGRHVLKISMVDPGIVLQKIILSDAQLPESYFGPPEVDLT